MKSSFVHLLAGLLLVARPSLHAAPLAEPGATLVAGANDAEWQQLFARLAPTVPVSSQFTEERYFPFRERPTVLHGEMRLDPQRGLSLHYTAPEPLTLVVDRRGLLQRDRRGRTRVLPGDSHAAAVNAALLPVLQFNEPEIMRRFKVQAARDGDDWRLDFVPLDPLVQRALGRLTAWGHADVLDRLQFRRSEAQRVEIRIENARRGVEFTADELTKYFR
jgi:hypothetical protein